MNPKYLLWGIIFAGLAVAFGAFGAHALKNLLPPNHLITFETGVRYQLMHAIALIVYSIFLQQEALQTKPTVLKHFKYLQKVGFFFTFGILLFSGSIYLLALQPLFSFQFASWLGPITPIGGICFMSAWVLWGYYIYKTK